MKCCRNYFHQLNQVLCLQNLIKIVIEINYCQAALEKEDNLNSNEIKCVFKEQLVLPQTAYLQAL